ncbi:hypothetical protein HK405_001501 [Cladochytrium tenue]|nr:hypothetical protein HK405_001501 [Cladochytrium tenue]
MTEAAALAAIYSATGGPTWSTSTGWDTVDESTKCTAHGIACSSAGSVVAINLSGNNLQGPIPDVFGNLSSVKSLFLSSNALVGAVPESLLDLPVLNDVDLSNNHLDGAVPNLLIDFSQGGQCLLNGNHFSCHVDMGTGCVTDVVPECNTTVPAGTAYGVNVPVSTAASPVLSLGAILGLVAAGLVAVGTVVGLVTVLRRRSSSRRAVAKSAATVAADGFDHGPKDLEDGAREYGQVGADVPSAEDDTAGNNHAGANFTSIHLNDPIVMTAGSAEAHQNDLDEAGARGAATAAGGSSFFGRLFGGYSAAAPAAAAAAPSGAADDDMTDDGSGEDDEAAAAAAAQQDPKALYSHQNAFAAASAKRAAAARARAAARKGRVSAASRASPAPALADA